MFSNQMIICIYKQHVYDFMCAKKTMGKNIMTFNEIHLKPLNIERCGS